MMTKPLVPGAACPMSELEIFQSLWAMELRRPDGVERSLEEAVDMVAEAGYAGMCMDLASEDWDKADRASALLRERRLGCMFNAFPRRVEDLRPVLRMARGADARFVNVIGQVTPLSVEGMVPVVRDWIEMGRDEGVVVLFETHRNCITNDLFSTLLLLDSVPEMRLCADLSHYLVDREFAWPLSNEDQGLIDRILARSDSFQGRVASREQIQVPLSFPQNQKWVALFLEWWESGFRMWRTRAREDENLVFLCELGPPEYAITGADGYELSDRWEESLEIRRLVEGIWSRLEKEATASPPQSRVESS